MFSSIHVGMQHTWYILLLFHIYSLAWCIEQQKARSRVKSIGLLTRKSVAGPRFMVNIHNLGEGTSNSSDSFIVETDRRINNECNGRVTKLLGADQSSSTEFRKHILMCRHEQLRVEVKNNRKYERILTPIDSVYSKVLNPYRKEYGVVTVNPHNFKFILQPKPCRKDEIILVTVHSATENTRNRAALRNTWANPKIFQKYLPPGYKSKLIFILGLPATYRVQMLINYEQEMYGDLVQVNFMDTYRNNTYKAIYNMKWISDFSGCPKAKLILKVDDDIMINLKRFYFFWNEFTAQLGDVFGSTSPFIAGNQFQSGPMRDPNTKWYLSKKEYKFDSFPIWFQGLAYMLSPPLAKEIYKLSFTTPYLFTDDVYVGIVADRVDNVYRYPLNEFYSMEYGDTNLNMASWQLDKVVFYHNPYIHDMYTLWSVDCDFSACS